MILSSKIIIYRAEWAQNMATTYVIPTEVFTREVKLRYYWYFNTCAGS